MWPSISFWLQRNGSQRQALAAKLQPQSPAASTAPTASPPMQLIAPSMLLDAPIYTGGSARTLQLGIWHRPNTSTPDKGGNTVLAAHRFTYTNPAGEFYHLDKLRPGDTLGVYWNHRLYRYTVRDTKVVKASEVHIEAPTSSPQLTLYTCTPLWLPKDRLVVIATPTEETTP